MRRSVALALLTLSCVLVALSIVAAWLEVGVLDGRRYVDAVAPVADDAAASEAATSLLVRRLVDEVSLTDAARELSHTPVGALPSGALGAARRLVRGTVEAVVASEQYADLWRVANQEAAPLLRLALVGSVVGPQVTLERSHEGSVLVDLSPVLVLARARLVRAGISSYRRPPVDRSPLRLEVADLGDLHDLRSGLHALAMAAWVLPVGAAACLAAGLLSMDRRLRGAAFFGGGLAVALGLALLGLWAARHVIVDRDLDPDVRPIQEAVFDAVTGPLRSALAIGVAVGAMLMVAAGEVARGPQNPPHT